MKSFLRFAFVFILLTGGASEAWAEDPAILEWHKAMTRVPLPKRGCFTVTYPKKKWVEEACATQVHRISRSAPVAGTASTPSAKVTSGHIATAIGSFDSVHLPSGSARDSLAYSLQLNSQHFDTRLCAGKSALCKGWQQFIYIPDNSGFVQYWLLNYGPNCPENWTSVKGDCTRTSNHGIPAGKERLSDLAHMSIGGTAVSDGEDVLTLVAAGHKLHACNSDNILGLAKGWRGAQFGVLGQDNGARLVFDPGTTLVVRTTVHNGTTDPPDCDTENPLTGETNNLQPAGPSCSYGGNAPAIVFSLSNVPGATSECVGAKKPE